MTTSKFFKQDRRQRARAAAIVLGIFASVANAVTIDNTGSVSYTDPASAVFTGSSNTVSVTVEQVPTLAKGFSPNSIPGGSVSTLTITLNNTNAFALTGVSVTDVFPTAPGAMTVASPPNASTTCGTGTVLDSAGGTLGAGDVGIRLSGGTVPAGGSCSVTVSVTATVNGTYTNTIPAGAVTSTEGISNSAPESANLIVAGITSPAVVTFYQYAPGAPGTSSIRFDGGGYGGDINDQPDGSNDQGGSTFTALPQPTTVYGSPLNLAAPLMVRQTTVYHAGEPVLITLTDANRNTDPAVREFITVTLTDPATGDTEVLRLQETGPDTGVFAAAIQSVGPGRPVVPNDGRISVSVNTALQVNYTDPTDATDVVQDIALVDPYGIVFDSVSGVPVNGATVVFINVDTGQPAQVFGDDGVSSFPSTLTSGGSAVDSSGTVYQFPPGGFRFPFVQPGNYRIVVTPPAGFTAPSTICSLGGGCPAVPTPPGPYAVVNGSFGDVFVIVPGPALNIDVPVDSAPGVTLFLQKAASQAEISAGDFLQYRLSLQNRDVVAANNTVVTDTLPQGFRYQPGSLRIEGAAVADPAISADGRTLSIAVGTVAPGATISIHYVVQTVSRAPAREAVNQAQAAADGGLVSNQALATVRVKAALFDGAFTIVGRVYENCGVIERAACGETAIRARPVPKESYTVHAKFNSGRDRLLPADERELDKLVVELKGRDIERIEVVGHTDNQRVGNPETLKNFKDNYGLSRARAQRVGDYLAKRLGLKPDQVVADGKGPDQPVASNDTAAGMAKNRRTDVRVIERTGDAQAPVPQACAAPTVGTGRGVPNVRVLMEDGTYVATDRDGLFHFEGVRPGTHVVQLDLDSLAPGLQVVPGIQNTRFAGRAYSQFVDVKGAGLWRTDFQVCPGGMPVGLTLSTQAGSLGEPESGKREYTLKAQFDSGKASLKPRGRSDVEALVDSLRGADIERIELIGHTDNERVGNPETIRNFKDNYGLSKARARAVGEALADGLGLAPKQIRTTGKGPDMPVADNGTADGRARNRRTEVIVFLRGAGKSLARPGALHHKIKLDGAAAVSNLRVTVILPEGTNYVPGTARLDHEKIGEPDVLPGAITFRLGNLAAPWSHLLEYDSDGAADCSTPTAIKAQLTFDTGAGKNLRTPVAEVSGNCVAEGGMVTGSAAVESSRQYLLVQGELEKAPDPELAAKTESRNAILSDVDAAGGNTDWLAGATPGIAIRFPEPGQSPRSPATRVVVQHADMQTVKLSVNGQAVDSLNFDGIETNANRTVAVSVWRGVPLAEGANVVEARVIDADGEEVQVLKQTVVYANAVARAELVPEQSVLIADGIHPPVIAVRMLDRDGKPVRAGVTGGFRLNAPFLPRQTVEQLQQRQLAGLDRFEPTFQVKGDQGIAYIELQPTTDSGEVVLGFTFQNQITLKAARVQELRTWISAAPRDWLLVGFAEGTVGYNTLKDNIAAVPAGTESGTYTDGQVSLYAKGSVMGKWLLTMAYDSGKPAELERRRSLLSTIDPNEFYTLYGDGSQQRYDAPSQGKLYLKIERAQFYALFGDYNTGLTVTQLSRYSRTLNGIKSELGGNSPVTYTAFASDTAQNYARDEIRGDGTSGLYRLSRRGIVLNSETIRIETRDRYQSQQVKDSRTLAQHIEYDIDYSNGTLFFREPINSRDSDFNPIFIVAEYETFGAGERELTAGGRVGVNLLDRKLSVGVSHIREEQQLGTTDLSGVDLKLRIGDSSELRFEGAQSDAQLGLASRDGNAYLAEIEHHSGKFDALVYSRRQESGFGLNQQNGSETGMAKNGADLQYNLTQTLSVAGQAYRQENLGSDATRDVGAAKLQYRGEQTTLSAGYQTAQDQLASGESFESQQATLGASRWMMDRKLELSANADIGLASDNANADFPSRYQLGAAYALTPEVRMFAVQELTDGDAFDTSLTRVGLQAAPWKGARLNSTLNQSAIGEYGGRTFAQMGLTQALQLGKGWGVDFALDSSRTFSESGQPAIIFNPNQPSTVTGATLTDDFVAVSGGLTYRADLWSWNARAESRHGSVSDRYGLATAFLRQAQAGVAFSAAAQAFQTELVTGSTGRYGNLNLSWAWRPLGSRWSLLDRLEFKYDELTAGSGAPGAEMFGNNTLNVIGDARSRRIINNFNLNRVSQEWTADDRRGNLFTLHQRNQWSLYYGAKYTLDQFDGVEYSGYTDLIGLEVRHDLTRHWDLGLQASSLNSWTNKTHQYSAGPSVGWSPVVNGWMSLGYNFVGFYDRDFEAARYTAQGPYLKLRFKFDQNTRLGSEDRKDLRAMDWHDYAQPDRASGVTP